MELPEKKLSDAELDIMLAIWQSPPPVQRADLEEQLQSHNFAAAPPDPRAARAEGFARWPA